MGYIKKLINNKNIYHYWDIRGIYMIECCVNNKKYIGSSSNITHRFVDHISSLIKNKHHNKYLQRAWCKYGIDNFNFVVIELVNNLENLYEKEEEWIKKLNTTDNSLGYNMSETCVKPHNYGKKMSDEQRKKLSEKRRGRPCTHKPPTKAVEGYLDGKVVIRFNSVREAYNAGYYNITRSIKRGLKCNKLFWKFKNID